MTLYKCKFFIYFSFSRKTYFIKKIFINQNSRLLCTTIVTIYQKVLSNSKYSTILKIVTPPWKKMNNYYVIPTKVLDWTMYIIFSHWMYSIILRHLWLSFFAESGLWGNLHYVYFWWGIFLFLSDYILYYIWKKISYHIVKLVAQNLKKKNRAINASKDLHTSYFLHDNKKHQGKNQKARLFKNFAWGVVYYYCGFFFGV